LQNQPFEPSALDRGHAPRGTGSRAVARNEEDTMAFAKLKFPIILFGAAQLLKHAARRHPKFKARVKEHNLVAQIMTRDEEIGRWFAFNDGTITTGAGLHEKPDIKLMFKNAKIGASLLMPPINWLDQINAQKDFNLTVDGPEYLTNWFAQTLMLSQSAGLKYGTKLRRGVTRYCNMTNGGPVFVDVKDGKIIRLTPIDLTDEAATRALVRELVLPGLIGSETVT